ncbi:MAG: hypothetical protein K2Y14_12505 [Burkholderiales bacterium]|jgi:hypothetical protein|nr:hypothetical protein [Burkholderiales bacterium]
MKQFVNIEHFSKWFEDRYFSNEVAYVKSLDQSVLMSTAYAENVLNLKPNCSIDESNLALILPEVIKLESRLIKHKRDGLVMEKLIIDGVPQITYWIKRQIIIGMTLYFLIEQSINGEFTLKQIISPPEKVKKVNYSLFVNFNEKEKSVLYLLGNDINIKTIAQTLNLTESTIRSYITIQIMPKLNDLGYLVVNREDVVKVAKTLKFDKEIPPKLVEKIKPLTLLLKSL